MATTKIANLFDPEVVSVMISAKLPKAIRFSPFATIDNTLAGQPGDTITVPKYAYIGDAEDVAEGEDIPMTALTHTTQKITVKKAGKGIELTDEAVLSGYGDPQTEAVNQLVMSIASKVDADCAAVLQTGTQTKAMGEAISYNGIVDAVDLFGEETPDPFSKVMFVNSKQVTTIRKDANFLSLDKYPAPKGAVVLTGCIGSIAGVQIVVSNRIAADDGVYKCPIVQLEVDSETGIALPALTIYMKRGVQVETDRDIIAKKTVLTADEHYAAALTNDSRVVVASFTA
jgi:N4-gp56 family major capsid protein